MSLPAAPPRRAQRARSWNRRLVRASLLDAGGAGRTRRRSRRGALDGAAARRPAPRLVLPLGGLPGRGAARLLRTAGPRPASRRRGGGGRADPAVPRPRRGVLG